MPSIEEISSVTSSQDGNAIVTEETSLKIETIPLSNKESEEKLSSSKPLLSQYSGPR